MNVIPLPMSLIKSLDQPGPIVTSLIPILAIQFATEPQSSSYTSEQPRAYCSTC